MAMLSLALICACGTERVGGEPYTEVAIEKTSCSIPQWQKGQNYNVGDKVLFDGKIYAATHENPGYDPAISAWYWSVSAGCDVDANSPAGQPTVPAQPGLQSGFFALLSEAQFNQLFSDRNAFYTYQGLVEAADATPGFAKEGSLEDRKREVAAALGNSKHESDHFKATREYNQANWPLYCDNSSSQSPCAPGQQYYGRGPIQISWNYNYGAAGRAIGADLLNNPDLVATNPKIAWQTMMWYWMTQSGPGSMTPHDAIVRSQSFGETIRSINGALECNGRNSAQVSARQQYYQEILRLLDVSAGSGNIG